MGDWAIQISDLSKRYRIGVCDKYPTVRETLMRAASSPVRKIRDWISGRKNASDAGSIWALRDVSFDVEEGEVVGIIGRNGAGKSTLLKVLAGITDPTKGYADIRGRVGSLLEVGTGFHQELTGRENIFMNGAILGMRRHEIKSKFDDIVAFSEVEAFLDTPVKRYSSGMYMRLAFAVAAHLQPDILIVDEVLAVGDAAFQKKCLGKMSNIAREGRTVLFVSHNMSAMQALCQKVLWLDGGNVQEIGSSSEVIHQYLSSVTSTMAIPVVDRTDRTGSGTVQLTSIRIETVDGHSVIRTTSRLRILLDYVSDKPLRQPQFRVDLHDISNIGIYTLDTKFTGELPETLPARGTVVCETGPIHLTPGRCHVNVEVKNYNVWADMIDDAAEFDVEAEDFYPTGHMPDRSEFIGVIPYQWSVDGAQSPH